MQTDMCDLALCASRAAIQRRWLVTVAALLLGLALAFALLHAVSVSAAAPRQDGLPPGQSEQEAAVNSDLQVQSGVSSETARPGDMLTFTLSYTNSLPILVSNVQIKDTLSKGQRFYAVYQSSPLIPPEQFTYSGADSSGYTLQWTLPSLAPNATGVITLTTRVLTNTEPNIDDPVILLGNAVEIKSTTDPVSGNSDDSVVMVIGPLFSLTKEATPSPVFPGHLLTYTIYVKNNDRVDAIPATDLRVSDHIPDSTTFHWASSPGVYDPDTRDVVWNLPGPLLPGATVAVQFSVRVTDRIDSGRNIVNSKTNYKARSAEVNIDVIGDKSLTVKTAPVLQKSVSDSNGGAVDVYPTQEVFYTISVFNPISQSLSGVSLTDTVPGSPYPFVFTRMTDGNPPPQVTAGGRKLSWTFDLAPWGSDTRSFAAQVPQYICFPDNKTNASFTNILAATHPDTYFSPEDGLAAVKVEAPLVMEKSVEPNHAMTGEVVTYTISLVNRGPFLVSSIRLTDTLEGNFHFLDMVSGPSPVPEYSYGTVVWDGLSVASGQTANLVFTAVVDGWWLTKYYNNLRATSPDACIPSRTHQAPVLIDPPLGLNKSADPTSVFLGESLQYSLQVVNQSDVAWTLDKITDDLPFGFVQVSTGSNLALIDFEPPEVIGPHGSWSGSFTARVDTADCNVLPKTYPNAKGNIRIYTLAPEVVQAVNNSNLAPVTVRPNVEVSLSTNRGALQIEDTLTYTLRLNNVSPYAAVGSTLTFNLPTGFEYLGSLQGPPPTSINGTQLVWQNATVPANTEVFLVFTARVKPGTSYGNKTPTLSASAPGVCFSKMSGGKVSVVEYVITFTKKALKTQLPPLTLHDYDLTINSKDITNIPLVAMTDTLPKGFIYNSMLAGPAPNVVQDGKIVWQNVSVPPGNTKWKIRLQSAPLYGTNYTNRVWATSLETRMITATSNVVSVLPLFDLQKTAGFRATTAGSLVPYTITLVNLSQATYNNIAVTDTLPSGFTFYRMRTGYPSPLTIGPGGTQPVWNIATLKSGCGSSGCIANLVFDVFVGPAVSPGEYLNQVIGDSPSGSVPGPIFTAPVSVTEAVSVLYLPIICK